MAKTLEAIIKENIPVQGIARAIRAHGYKIPSARKTIKPPANIQGFGEGYLKTALNSPGRFVKLDDGWVKDFVLGIEWGPSSKERMNWESAKKYCADLGGRLPERLELFLLTDDTKRDPAINKEMFPDTMSGDYWSGTTYAGWTDLAWIVSFGDGDVYGGGKTDVYYVRPVRSSQ